MKALAVALLFCVGCGPSFVLEQPDGQADPVISTALPAQELPDAAPDAGNPGVPRPKVDALAAEGGREAVATPSLPDAGPAVEVAADAGAGPAGDSGPDVGAPEPVPEASAPVEAGAEGGLACGSCRVVADCQAGCQAPQAGSHWCCATSTCYTWQGGCP
jgi:hypothetical protein